MQIRAALITAVVMAGSATPAAAQAPATAADTAAIRQAALDYIEGWYTRDAERMRRAVHPDLAKRIVATAPDGRSRVANMTAEQLVDATARPAGRAGGAPARADVRILDIFGTAAAVRVDAEDWVDYLHISRTDEGWRIINVLWELRGR